MVELLKVLCVWLSFFFAENRYRLVDSEVGTTYGDALVEFASDTLRWRLVRDRSQISLNCRPARGKYKDWEWFSTDVLIRLITGCRVESAELTEEVASWFQANLSDIEERFSADRFSSVQQPTSRLSSTTKNGHTRSRSHHLRCRKRP